MSAEQRQRDRALAAACANGCRKAWEQIVTSYTTHVRFTVIRTLRARGWRADDALVEDLVAKVFFKLVVNDFRRLRQYRGQASLKSWLRVMAANACLDFLRKQRPTAPVHPSEDDAVELVCPRPLPSEDVAHAQLVTQLRSMWSELPEADREFAELYFVRELSFDEIASMTDTTHGALYARKNRIRKKLTTMAAEAGWFEVLDRKLG